MGLPIWRDPEEKKSSKDNVKVDPTACSRSSIRRRPSIYGRRNPQPRLPRETSLRSSRFARSPPPLGSLDGLREPRRGEERGVPPISTLLESADQNTALPPPPPPPPPFPESRNYNPGPHRAVRYADSNSRTPVFPWNDVQRSLRNARSPRTAALSTNLHSTANRFRNERQRPVEGATYEFNHAQPSSARVEPSPGTMPTTGSHGQRSHPQQYPHLTSHQEPPSSHDETNAQRGTLPTPPQDMSGAIDDNDDDALLRSGAYFGQYNPNFGTRVHINGLGDRNRSPTPGDGWEIMRSTITPDETLPSAESSFTSAAASQSFGASNDTQITELESAGLSNDRDNRDFDSQSDSASSADLDDWEFCNLVEHLDPHDNPEEMFAEVVYYEEMRTPAGRNRIRAHEQRFIQRAHDHGPVHPDMVHLQISFALVEDAMQTEDGRARLQQVRDRYPDDDGSEFPQTSSLSRRINSIRRRLERRTDPNNGGPPSPDSEVDSEEDSEERSPAAARDGSQVVHEYLSRYASENPQPHSDLDLPSPEPLPAYPDANTIVSNDAPVAQPVSPPARRRSEREISEALLSGDIQDLDSMRRIVERLAARADVPEEWWMSMGLNLSRTRPQDRSPPPRASRTNTSDTTDTRREPSGRTERNNAQL